MSTAVDIFAQDLVPAPITQVYTERDLLARILALAGGSGPATNAAAVTPNNSTDLAHATRALYVAADGDVEVNMVGTGSGVTFAGLTAGMILPIRAKRVLATGTTATVIALW